jgi:FlaG/FlaF family flagellin (archaellin)
LRKITKIRRSIRAISPVISVLLMIVIAVVASLVAYAWVMGYIGFQTAKTGQAVQIQSVAFDDTGAVASVYLQNVGDGTVKIMPDQCLYINGGLVLGDIGAASPTLVKGDTLQIDAGTNGPFTPGEIITVKVTTEGGTYSQLSQVVPESGSGGSGNPTQQYQITVTQTANGNIAPGTGSYDAGSTPSFTITPTSGYHIATITANGASVTVTNPAGQTYQFAALTGTATLTATFAVNTVQYQVTVTQTANGNIAPGTGSYDAGSTPSFTITPNNGYQIATITANGASVTVTTPAGQTYQFAALAGPATLTATFTAAGPAADYVDTNNQVHEYWTSGSHSNFASMKDVGAYDTLSEASSYGSNMLDLEVQFTGITNPTSYHHVEIQTGAFSDSENIIVSYWNGNSYTPLGGGTGQLTANSLNTFTVTLSGSTTTLELRFSDGTQWNDYTTSTWQIDYVRLVA